MRKSTTNYSGRNCASSSAEKKTKAELDKIMEKFLDFCQIMPTYDEMRQLIAWAVSNGTRFDV